ncbi:MAG: S8 family serine peptidase [Phycisphaerae bacterium]|nr:S8 family serine peptidase [Phycisphaerae bacterium]
MIHRIRGRVHAGWLLGLLVSATGFASQDIARHQEVAAPSTKLSPALVARLADSGDAVKAWVFLSDKAVSAVALDTAIDRVADEFSPRAIERRQLRADNASRGGRLFDSHDLPVASAYVDDIAATGASVCVTSRWLNAVSVRGTQEQIEAIAALPFVDRLQLVAQSHPIDVMNATEVAAPTPRDVRGARLDYGVAATQLEQINVLALHEAGYTGAGVIIGILDTGFRQDHNAFNNPEHPLNVIAQHDFINDDSDVGIEPGDPSDQHQHGTLILGCIGSYMPGECVGGAYDASFILCKTEDTAGEYPAEEDNYVAGLEYAELHGADVVTSSLGYIDWYTQNNLDGETAVTTIAVNIATSNGLHCCTAAGNEGHDGLPYTSHLIAPSDAFQVITCGAVDSTGAIASFSSDGPTADGRAKPELVARGVNTHSVSASNTTGYTTADGTSLSTPLVACAVACLVQAHPEWTPDEMRNHLFMSADYGVASGTYDPFHILGYGLVNAYAAAQDCNENGLPDSYDVRAAISQDCQHNDIPDDCELAAGSSADCNNNAIPDECDIAPSDPTLTNDVDAVLGWQELYALGQSLNLDRNGVANITMPFPDPAFGHTLVQIGNNGAVGLGAEATLPASNRGLPSSLAFDGGSALFPFWDDLDTTTGQVWYMTVGGAPNRRMVVEWRNMPHYPGDYVLDGDEVTFEVQIFETPINGVWAQFLYLDTDFDNSILDNGASATIGFQINNTWGSQWSFNHPTVNPSVVLSVMTGLAPVSTDADGNGVPDECEQPPQVGDLNCDGSTDVFDIDAFVMALADSPAYAQAYPGCDITLADCNGDQSVDIFDIDAFVALLVGK